eukprot:TRINITY_DN2074_c0_g1_i8.p1 TRINITY_DN2074_c0_g1~~TRINITY_DN2074_c0_g1_i8.p1  ORF type:complete len:636 (-),score=202.48 TRINITY_DN2074_c0_g1_i8:1182-3089(-)
MSLIESSSQVQSAYEPTLWAKVFHSVPHVNISGQEVDSRFNPSSESYLESLGILGSLPAGWLIATLLLLLLYLLTRCCDTRGGGGGASGGKSLPAKKLKSRPIRCCLSFFALGCVGSLSIGFLGNHLSHGGVNELGKATRNINTLIGHSQNLAAKYLSVLSEDLNENLSHLFDGPFRPSASSPSLKEHGDLMNNVDLVFYNISEAQKAMKQIQFAISHQENPIDFREVTRWPEDLENIRWPATMALQGLLTLFCLLLFVGAIIHSRCILILFSVLGLFSIILLWLLSSIYITVSVATADFCYEPTPWVLHAIEDKVPRDISAYYLQCSNDQVHPFQHLIVTSQRAVEDIGQRVRRISSIARTYYPHNDVSPYLDGLERSSENIIQLVQDLVTSLKCDQIYRSYNTALVSICDNGLLGIILMLLSSAVSGLFFTILVWCNSHTWIYFKHKGRYVKVDDQDPYMPLATIERSRSGVVPHGPPSGLGSSLSRHHTPPQTPSFAAAAAANAGGGLAPSRGVVNGGVGGKVFDPVYETRGGGHAPVSSSHYAHNTLGHGVPLSSHRLGTLGRASNTQGHKSGDYSSSTMTLGRRGHYSSLRHNGGRSDHSAAGNVPVGLNFGQYSTLSKQCKTLESSDYY